LTELERRLRGRSTDSEETIRRRLGDALADMTHWNEFDYAVVNDDFESALTQLKDIFAGTGEECRTDNPSVRREIEVVMA
jgi:guanylate kinase